MGNLYAVMWNGPLHGRLLELWGDELLALKSSKQFNKQMTEGKSPILHNVDLSMGIREYTCVEPIEINKKFIPDPDIEKS